MKEIKAFIHRNRIADIVHALKAAEFGNISVIDVKGMLKALDSQ
jgi:nitrogen regulatory protein P-II 1